MIRTVVIEDEGDSRKMLLELLHEHCRQINIVAEADSVKSGLKAIAEQKPQLVFLDIELKAETSFEILAQVPEIDFELIFTKLCNDLFEGADFIIQRPHFSFHR